MPLDLINFDCANSRVLKITHRTGSAKAVAAGTAEAAGTVAGTVSAPFVYVPARALGGLFGTVAEDEGKDTPCLHRREPSE